MYTSTFLSEKDYDLHRRVELDHQHNFVIENTFSSYFHSGNIVENFENLKNIDDSRCYIHMYINRYFSKVPISS